MNDLATKIRSLVDDTKQTLLPGIDSSVKCRHPLQILLVDVHVWRVGQNSTCLNAAKVSGEVKRLFNIFQKRFDIL